MATPRSADSAPSAGPTGGLAALARLVRVHQWSKNLLVLVPAVAAHRMGEPGLARRALAALAAFCLVASSAYVVNDFLDLDADRRHPSKSLRPLASGAIRPSVAAGVAALMLLCGLGISVSLPLAFTGCLAAYWVTTLAYSMRLKRLPALDVVVLAGLYTVRILGGSLATGVPTSSWLFTLSMFLFLSLALVKRTAEIRVLRERGGAPNEVAGRGYLANDLPHLTGLGMASALVAVLVLALYLGSPDVARLYSQHQRLWLLCPLALYWVTRIWLLASRGLVDEDPVVFALKDPASYVVGALAVLVVISGI